MLLKEGQVIRDVYEVDRFLGEGAFGEAYRVKHKFLGNQVMKVLKSPSASPEETERDLSEAIILSRIGHPNIVRVFDAGTLQTSTGQCSYFTMEYVPGGNLETFWRHHGANFVPIPDTVDIIRQVCTGLAVAHAERPPIIHRDIKSENILIGYDSQGLRIRLTDFGLAKKVNPLTLLASAVGTPAFKPPEFLSNVDSCAADVWGIGTTLYLLLTDRLPFPIASIMDFSSGKCFKRPLSPPSRFNPQVGPLLDSIVSRALALKPADRYANATEMLNDLMEWTPPHSPPSSKDKRRADQQKTALQSSSQPDDASPEQLLAKALKLSRDATKLTEAADLLETALTRHPDLRDKYEYHLKLWRRGIIM